MQLFRKFGNNYAGSITVPFALCMTGLAIAGGCALDYVRWHKAQTELQAVADSAVVSAGASAATSTTSLRKIAENFIVGNNDVISSRNVEVTSFEHDATSQRLSITLQGELPASLMNLAGISVMRTEATSTVKMRGSPPIEAVLVLDTTYSMVGTKIDTLKVAAKNLVKTVLSNPKARVGIVPFANYVNVGVSRRNDPGFDVPENTSSTSQSCSTTYPNAKNCKNTKTTSTCTSTKDGVTSSYSCSQTTTTCDSWGQPVKTCKNVTSTSKFRGCVGSRTESHRALISSLDHKYPGMMNSTCADEILDLTEKVGPVVSAIETLSVNGETYLPAGITWGWNMLSAEEPLSSALPQADLEAKGGKKVLIIMTDGANTLAPTSKNAGPHGSATTGPYKNTPYANTLTSELCKNIKADKIWVYTVLYDVEDAAVEKMLNDCASAPSNSYVAKNSEELVAAFDGIAKQLATLKIVE